MRLCILHMCWFFTTYETGKCVDFLRTLHLVYVMASINATEQSLWGKKSSISNTSTNFVLFRLWFVSNSEIVHKFQGQRSSICLGLSVRFFPNHLSLTAHLPKDQEKEYLDSVENNSSPCSCWYNLVCFLKWAHKLLLSC